MENDYEQIQTIKRKYTCVLFPFAETIIKAAKVRPTILSQEEVQKKVEEYKDTNKESGSSNVMELSVLDVELTDEYQEIVNTIRNNLYHLVCRLKEQSLVPSHYTIDSLDPDYTRFLVKQFETELSERSAVSDEKIRAYKMIVSLHAMVTVVDLITSCSLPVAIGKP